MAMNHDTDDPARSAGTHAVKPVERTDKAAGKLRDEARTTADEAKTAAREISDAVRHQARGVGEWLKEEGSNLLAQQKERAAGKVGDVAAAMDEAAENLRRKSDPRLAEVATELGEKLEKAADYIRHRDVRGLFHDSENYARRRTEVFLGAMFVGGLAVARFLKASRRPGSPDSRNRPTAPSGEQPIAAASTPTARATTPEPERNPAT